MSKVDSGSRFKRLLCSALCAGLAACGTGPLDQPELPLPALTLQARFGAAIPAAATSVAVTLAMIPYCPAIDASHLGRPLPPAAPWTPVPTQPLALGEDTVDVVAHGGGDPRGFGCELGLPLIRFFEPSLHFSPADGYGPPAPWVSRDKVVAYADTAVTYQPFGPAEEPISLPPGYSMLRRTCSGESAAWRVEPVSLDEPITFSPPILPVVNPQPRPPERALREQSERLLLRECGIEAPPADTGDRVTFDRATSIQFSADGSQLLYLVTSDPTDPERLSSIRSFDLSTGSVRQVAAVRDAYKIQTTARPGDIYVWTPTDFQKIRVDEQAVGQVIVPAGSWVHSASPDGRWLGFIGRAIDSGTGARDAGTWILDSDTGATRPAEVGGGLFWGWTPASQMMVIENPTVTDASSYVVVMSPIDGHEIERFPFAELRDVVWSENVPYSVGSPVLWRPEQSAADFIANGRGFGVSVQAPGASDAVEVLDHHIGSIEVAARSEGAAFLWARQCMGLFETVCTFELHRVTLPTLEDQVVAVTDSAAPVAVSPGGDRVAIAARDGIFIRRL